MESFIVESHKLDIRTTLEAMGRFSSGSHEGGVGALKHPDKDSITNIEKLKKTVCLIFTIIIYTIQAIIFVNKKFLNLIECC